MFKNLLDRFREPSSYASIAAVLALLGFNLDAELVSRATQAGAAVAALAGFFLGEKKAAR